MNHLQDTLLKVQDHQTQRLRLTADIASVSQRLKALIVKAEDARLMGEMQVGR